MSHPFYLLDVFAHARYTGNPLAVVRHAADLTGEEMQRIAREINFSETTFILSDTPRQGGYDVRIFTPGMEVPFAGHPTLGTAHIIRTEIEAAPVERIVLHLGVGPIPVTLEQANGGTTYWMEQVTPTFGQRFAPAPVASLLSLDLGDIDPRFPIREVSTGLPHLLVPLASLAALQRARLVLDAYWQLVRRIESKAILVFTAQPHEPVNQLAVRMFAPAYGIPEDPATGSGNGCLAAYLVHQRYFGAPQIDLRAEQGYEMGRPSLLLLRGQETEDKIRVSVGGQALTIARGEWQ